MRRRVYNSDMGQRGQSGMDKVPASLSRTGAKDQLVQALPRMSALSKNGASTAV
jgi:hypothetical protein